MTQAQFVENIRQLSQLLMQLLQLLPADATSVDALGDAHASALEQASRRVQP